MLAPGWWRYCCRVGRCVVTNVGPTQESDLHVSVYADGEVSQVGSRVELFEEIRRDRRSEGLSIRERAERHKVHRRAVCRCFRGTSLSAINQASITPDHWSVAGRGLATYSLRGGGNADANACRTARRWTLWRSASSRIDRPSLRRSRRISSNSSTREPT